MQNIATVIIKWNYKLFGGLQKMGPQRRTVRITRISLKTRIPADKIRKIRVGTWQRPTIRFIRVLMFPPNST